MGYEHFQNHMIRDTTYNQTITASTSCSQNTTEIPNGAGFFVEVVGTVWFEIAEVASATTTISNTGRQCPPNQRIPLPCRTGFFSVKRIGSTDGTVYVNQLIGG